MEESSGEPSKKKLKSTQASGSQQKSSMLRVYTDGSSRGNGKVGAMAGVGVFFGEGDPRNLSEALEGPVQTNQRAELTGLLRALQIAPKDKDLEIITDSSYSINCVDKWYKKWLNNGWRTATGVPVTNKDLISAIRILMEERDTNGVRTELTWTKGHSNDTGNIIADRLAVAGAMAHRAS
ncbi:ribonuclease H-like domain-containing protein [Xylogone sp. PMI_703]|nr:ribonuclease H-like domain-containing protein [Xylogone sp. PMI_703]